jgi:hypothetical protein
MIVLDFFDCHPNQFDRFGGRFVFVRMDPRAVFADIGNFDKKRIDPGSFDRFSEGFQVHVGGTGGNDDGGESEFFDFLVDELLSRLAAHVFVVDGAMDTGNVCNFFGNFFAVNGSGDIFAAPTGKNADFHRVEQDRQILGRALYHTHGGAAIGRRGNLAGTPLQKPEWSAAQ